MPTQTIKELRRAFRFPVLGRLSKYIVAVTIYATLVVHFGRGLIWVESSPDRTGEAAIAGVLFGWLMGFRTTTAYTRWWDGRGLWGQLVNDSRNLILKASVYVKDPTERAKLGEVVARFAEALRDHLRLPPKSPGPHKPMLVADELFRLIRGWNESGQIDGFTFLAFDQHAQQLMNVCGACEKIRSTPLTASYRGLLRKGIAFYLLLLPWLMNDEHGWLTVPVTVLVAYAVVGMELIASNIEDPFGTDGDDLRIDAIVETIRRATTTV
ncbi:MAG: hypothetical protein K8U57_00990 [Planctomycetes bacterium]|nr:hypothetical protein [Planctomycetota bacterium]